MQGKARHAKSRSGEPWQRVREMAGIPHKTGESGKWEANGGNVDANSSISAAKVPNKGRSRGRQRQLGRDSVVVVVVVCGRVDVWKRWTCLQQNGSRFGIRVETRELENAKLQPPKKENGGNRPLPCLVSAQGYLS